VLTDPGGAASVTGMVWADPKGTLARSATATRTVLREFEVFISRWDFISRLEFSDLERVRKGVGRRLLAISVFFQIWPRLLFKGFC